MNRDEILNKVKLGEGGMYRAEFLAWLRDNFHIFVAFTREANAIWNAGRRHYSARTIVEWLRHETSIREVGGEFKINDHYMPDMARLYMSLHPERKLFELRTRQAA